jgi:two-component system alkaline phosphatase synthesis response regulator PhoP
MSALARVVIAEDEPAIVASLEFLMRRAGYETRVAGDGERALELVREFSPDVVILDLMLPKRSGYDVCREIRHTPALAETRVLMLSARGGANEIDRGLSAGADDYVTKPFSTQDLVRRVSELLRLRRSGDGEGGHG